VYCKAVKRAQKKKKGNLRSSFQERISSRAYCRQQRLGGENPKKNQRNFYRKKNRNSLPVATIFERIGREESPERVKRS